MMRRTEIRQLRKSKEDRSKKGRFRRRRRGRKIPKKPGGAPTGPLQKELRRRGGWGKGGKAQETVNWRKKEVAVTTDGKKSSDVRVVSLSGTPWRLGTMQTALGGGGSVFGNSGAWGIS